MLLLDNDLVYLSHGAPFINPDDVDTTTTNLKFTSSLDRQNSTKAVPKIIGGYAVGNLLGSGGFGEVYSGVHQHSDEKAALKFMRKTDILRDLDSLQLVNKEIQCLKALRHSNIIRLIHVSQSVM
jgi:serine/threonine protein kinase